ncbi:4-alpha-glucanotransferase [Novosphingobium panipatense]|jgi:4-alpha-glucanotransferase|uniref:4-alpha-glucanotransferase n=1 Tax=Novosphingobium TaxID=165696 RepID=UPI000CDB26C4|nr:4-alpha-glucanotransferase [Novosphingobium sp. HII-3]
MPELYALAEAIGLCRIWHDVEGKPQVVADTTLRAIAGALGYPADSDAEIAASLKAAEQDNARPPALIVAEAGVETALPPSLSSAAATLPAIEEPGYYEQTIAGHPVTIAVAPASCRSVESFGKGRLWGPALQIPALRGRSPQPFGAFGELAEAVAIMAARGADAVAINPVHALFPGDGEGFSPYSPSSRLYLNGAMGDPALVGLAPFPAEAAPEGALIDWEAALPQRLQQMRALFRGLDAATRQKIADESAAQGEGLRRQAIYDALYVHFRECGARRWQDWPTALHDPDGPAVAAFAREHAEEVAFHVFAQWLARKGLAEIQRGARAAGMAIGLVADLAVGVHTGGADVWSMGDAFLQGVTIGAPPDPLGPLGQNWMLTSFSPHGLARSGYQPWIATIRAALSTAGALRIDHAFGLSRLWVIPDGMPSTEGAYLRYPFQDLIRLLALEAHLADAVLVAEDLGTMPEGFGPAIDNAGLLGMRVLWFERAADEGFIGASDYDPQAVAMTGTHDTPTVAGWWTGLDIEWAERLGRLPEGTTRQDAEARRAWERGRLWATLAPDALPRPSPAEPEPVVDAALAHIGRTPCGLAIVPVEDVLAEREQLNLPGTVTEHPNWRRRLKAPLAKLLDEPANAARLRILAEARKGPAPSEGPDQPL